MIAKICGKLKGKSSSRLLIETGGITYEVLIPMTVMQRLEENLKRDSTIELITYHYLQSDPSKSFPVMIGFLNEIEKEFFESFITVSGIGPKAALRALNKPISMIASAIDEGNVEFLKSLPGIGEQRAREIIAKLQKKIAKFGLIRDSQVQGPAEKTGDIQEEALSVLSKLGYKRQEAADMIKRALESAKKIENTEQLLNELYKQKK